MLKQVSVQNILYEKLWSLDPLYDKKLLISYNIFRTIKKSSKSARGLISTRTNIFHINFLSCADWPSGYSVTEILYLNWSTEWYELEYRYWLFTFQVFESICIFSRSWNSIFFMSVLNRLIVRQIHPSSLEQKLPLRA